MDLTTPQVTHGILVDSITELQAKLTDTQGPSNAAAKKEYKLLVKTIKRLRHEHTQLAQLVTMLCSPFTGMLYTDNPSPMKAHVTRTTTLADLSTRMQVGKVKAC